MTVTSLDRIKAEKEALDSRIEKFNNLFGKIKSDNWEAHKKLLDSFSNEQKNLMKKQLKVMKEYSRILGRRIILWTKEK